MSRGGNKALIKFLTPHGPASERSEKANMPVLNQSCFHSVGVPGWHGDRAGYPDHNDTEDGRR